MENRKPKEIERDLEETRSRVDETLDELNRKLSPGELLDQALNYVKDGPGEFGSNLGRQVRDNPLPISLIGIGLAWLMASGQNRTHSTAAGGGTRPGYGESVPYVTRGSYAAEAEHEADSDHDRLSRVRAAGDAVQRRADETEQSFQERRAEAEARVMEMRRRADESAASFRERVERARSDLGERARASRERARRAGEEGRRYAEDAARRGRDNALRAFDTLAQRPLLSGAFGLTIGALMGSLMPVSAREEEVISPYRERVREQGARAFDEAMRRGERIGREAADAADRQAREEGVHPGEREPEREAGEAARDTASRAERVADRVLDKTREEADREIDRTGSRDRPVTDQVGR